MNESMDRRKIHALKAEVKRLNELLCPHRQSRCVDCIELEKKQKTGKEVDIDGYIGEEGIEYIGKAYERNDGTWVALAKLDDTLALVEVKLTENIP